MRRQRQGSATSRGIIAFRNQLVHNYPNVDNNAVWVIVQREVPLLLERVRPLLSAED